ncbi:C40 family peptidase [Actinokineospora globicatena]|uniref:NlpC/P60 domain-containing protein n=1 Tax=Actinokineospora globicatena TaxID=103729 RepID=A0A9W6QHI0_9PSEU|nr:C40 family peptidase [Actinokineospora globicatena]GLW90548.1 hypothetical protein Aglo03_13640 [Actinokineospora globicatena]
MDIPVTTKTRSRRTRYAVALTAGLTALALNSAVAPTASAAPAPCEVLTTGAGPLAELAVVKACEQVGVNYVYGGGHGTNPGPTGGGLDCSGLVRYAYALATGEDIINGPTKVQWQSSRAVARFTKAEGFDPLLPGDLLFYGASAGSIHHVALYLGAGQVVHAPYTGTKVRVANAAMGDYFGSIRLFAGGTTALPVPGVDRIAYTEGDTLWAKDGDLDLPPELQEDDVAKYQFEGDRVGVLTHGGALLVKEGDLGPGWHTVNADSVTDFELSGARIGFTEGEDLYVVDGDIDGAAVLQDAEVAAFQVEGDRVGVLNTDGDLLVKEGDLEPGWVEVAGGVRDFQLHGARIAYRVGGDLWAQDETLDAASTLQESNVAAYQLSGDRIAVQTTAGALLVKEGDLGPGWEIVNADSVTAFHLDSDRIAFAEGDELWAKEGDLDAGLTHLASDVDSFQLDGDRIAVLRDGALDVKEGDLDADWYPVNPDSVTTFQIGADITRPVR